MAQIIDPDDLRRFVGYCPKCGYKVYLIFVVEAECIHCGWKGDIDDLLDDKGLRREKLKKIIK